MQITKNSTGGYCFFNATSQSDGGWNYSVWINDSAGSWGWNGTWLITTDATCMNAELVQPPAVKNVAHNFTFLVNATVLCRGGFCGNVSGTVRYNGSSDSPDTAVSTAADSYPFYIMGGAPNPQNCSGNPISQDVWCSLAWTVNATGKIGDAYKVGVLFESNMSGAGSNHTSNSTVNMVSCVTDVTIQWDNISFGEPVAPGQRGTGTGNGNNQYNVSVNSTGCKIDLYIKGADLQCNDTTCSGYHIQVGNVTWSNVSNDYGTSHMLTGSWQEINKSVQKGANATTYYWINIPEGVAYGLYNSTLSIEGVEEGEEP